MLVVTVDIEDWYHLSPITGAPSSKFQDVPRFFTEWNNRYDYLTKPTLKVLELLKEMKIKATFFIVADIVEHYPGLIDSIIREGHEIACHGLHHACKINPKTKEPLMTKEEFAKRTIQAKTILEKASGQPIMGYRAPNAYIAGWMIDVLEDIGFKYDSSVSVNSFYNKSDRILRKVESMPYYPIRGGLELGYQKRGIIEIPFPYFTYLFKFPTAGGPMLRFFGARYIMRGLNESLKRGNTIFYFHPIDIVDENFPMNSSVLQKLFWLEKGQSIETRIRYIMKNTDTKITTIKELLSIY